MDRRLSRERQERTRGGFVRARALTALLPALALLAACASVPAVQQAFAPGSDGAVVGRPLQCTGASAPSAVAPAAQPLPGPQLRILSWNLHKNEDPGWDADLARFAAASDLLLIQEAALSDALQRVLHDAGYDWLLAGSFNLNGVETGVLSAARVRPVGACVQRYFEPLLGLPKAALVARYRMEGVAGTLAAANLHSINFTLGADDYRKQLEALARELAMHRGPIIVGGDFNTWTDARRDAVEATMTRLGLVPVVPDVDLRSRFLGQQVDYVYVRGLEVLRAEVPVVASSDHNPVLATLRLTPPAR